MATLISSVESLARLRLQETSANFWTSQELVDIIIAGIKDLWRDIVDLKQEYYLTVDATNVSLAASTATLSGVPADLHKVYLIEPRDTSADSSNHNLVFVPRDMNSKEFQAARSLDAVDPSNATIYYCVTGQGAPVSAPVIYIAPQVTSATLIRLVYIPTLAAMTSASSVPVPGEADNALVAWCVAFARAKEREDRSPDPNWLAIYATEKQHLLQSLGVRQLQEPTIVNAMFEEFWG